MNKSKTSNLNGMLVLIVVLISFNLNAQFYTLEHIRASDDTIMGIITDGYSITAANATTFTVNAIPISSIGSAQFILTGPISYTHTESVVPYALYNNTSSTDFTNGPDLIPGAYTLTVNTWSGAGNSGTQIAQDVVNFTVTDSQAPSAPVLSITEQTDTTINLSWIASTDDLLVTGYNLYKNNVLEATLGNVLSYEVTGVIASTSYNFTVTALDGAGNESLVSNVLVVTTNDALVGGNSGNWSLNNQDVYYNNGNVGIGVEPSQIPAEFDLAVGGGIIAEEVKIQLRENGTWPDFVFSKGYNLASLKEVEEYIKEKGHLKNIPSAKDVAKNGILLGDMNAKLLEKIEELTLYMIQMEKRLKMLEK